MITQDARRRGSLLRPKLIPALPASLRTRLYSSHGPLAIRFQYLWPGSCEEIGRRIKRFREVSWTDGTDTFNDVEYLLPVHFSIFPGL